MISPPKRTKTVNYIEISGALVRLGSTSKSIRGFIELLRAPLYQVCPMTTHKVDNTLIP